jgi:hypothetical protein
MPVIIPIKVKATIKAYLPPPHLIGGMIENNNFQLISKNYNIASLSETFMTTISSSSIYGPSIRAFLNYCFHDGSLV